MGVSEAHVEEGKVAQSQQGHEIDAAALQRQAYPIMMEFLVSIIWDRSIFLDITCHDCVVNLAHKRPPFPFLCEYMGIIP